MGFETAFGAALVHAFPVTAAVAAIAAALAGLVSGVRAGLRRNSPAKADRPKFERIEKDDEQ